MNVLAITHHAGVRVAEIGFLLVAIAGAALAVGALVPGGRRIWPLGGGVALGAGAVLLIVATHWGNFG